MSGLDEPILIPSDVANLAGHGKRFPWHFFSRWMFTSTASGCAEDAVEQGRKDEPTCICAACMSAKSAANEDYQWYAYILYGSAILMPYNAMLNSVDYFGEMFGGDFQFLNAIFLTTPNFITLFITAFVWKPDNRLGAFWGFAGLCATCLLVPFLQTRTLVLAAGAVIGVFNSIAQAAINGLGSQSPKLIPAFQTGVGFSGVMASTIRIFTKVSLGLETGTQLFFALGALMSLAALILLRVLPQQQVTMAAPAPASRCGLLKRLPVLLSAFFVNFMITLSFFPGLVATIAPRDIGRVLTNGWWPVLLFASFNVFDFLGKYFANSSVAQFDGQAGARRLLLLQTVRMALVYAMAYIANTDIAVWSLVATLAFTNGWFGSAGFGVQHRLLEPELRDQAAVVATFFILFGITVGSFLGQVVFD